MRKGLGKFLIVLNTNIYNYCFWKGPGAQRAGSASDATGTSLPLCYLSGIPFPHQKLLEGSWGPPLLASSVRGCPDPGKCLRVKTGTEGLFPSLLRAEPSSQELEAHPVPSPDPHTSARPPPSARARPPAPSTSCALGLPGQEGPPSMQLGSPFCRTCSGSPPPWSSVFCSF